MIKLVAALVVGTLFLHTSLVFLTGSGLIQRFRDFFEIERKSKAPKQEEERLRSMKEELVQKYDTALNLQEQKAIQEKINKIDKSILDLMSN
jgi:hypothetical protein